MKHHKAKKTNEVPNMLKMGLTAGPSINCFQDVINTVQSMKNIFTQYSTDSDRDNAMKANFSAILNYRNTGNPNTKEALAIDSAMVYDSNLQEAWGNYMSSVGTPASASAQELFIDDVAMQVMNLTMADFPS